MTGNLERRPLDCAACREMKLADPRERAPALLEHLRECPPCARFASRIDAFEERLCATLEVPVPDGLAEQIILARPRAGRLRRLYQRLRDALGGGRAMWFGPALGALTATVVLGVALLVLQERDEPANPLARSFIAHVVAEPEVLLVNDTVQPGRVAEVLARYGSRLQGPLEVSFLGQCAFGGGVYGDHLVVRTPHGVATILLLHGAASAGGPHTEDRFTAVTLPLKNASMGIVTESEASALEVRRLMQRLVKVEG